MKKRILNWWISIIIKAQTIAIVSVGNIEFHYEISNTTRSTSSIKKINKSIAKIIKYVALDKVCHWLKAREKTTEEHFFVSSFLLFFFCFVRLHVTALLCLHHPRHLFKLCQRWQKLYFFFWKKIFFFLFNNKKKIFFSSQQTRKFSWPTLLHPSFPNSQVSVEKKKKSFLCDIKYEVYFICQFMQCYGSSHNSSTYLSFVVVVVAWILEWIYMMENLWMKWKKKKKNEEEEIFG